MIRFTCVTILAVAGASTETQQFRQQQLIQRDLKDEGLGSFIRGIGDRVEDGFDKVAEIGHGVATGLGNAAGNIASHVGNTVDHVVDNMIKPAAEPFIDAGGAVLDGIGQAIDGIKDGVATGGTVRGFVYQT